MSRNYEMNFFMLQTQNVAKFNQIQPLLQYLSALLHIFSIKNRYYSKHSQLSAYTYLIIESIHILNLSETSQMTYEVNKCALLNKPA